MPQQGQTPDMQQMMAMADKDLGNLKMEVDETDLGTVTVATSAKQQFEWVFHCNKFDRSQW